MDLKHKKTIHDGPKIKHQTRVHIFTIDGISQILSLLYQANNLQNT